MFEEYLRREGLQTIRDNYELSATQMARLGMLVPSPLLVEHLDLERAVSRREALVADLPRLVSQYAESLARETEQRLRKHGLRDGQRLRRTYRHLWQNAAEGAPTRHTREVSSIFSALAEMNQIALVGEGGIGKTVELLSTTRDLAHRVEADGVVPLPVDLRYVDHPTLLLDEVRRLLDQHATGLGECLPELMVRYRCVLLLDAVEQLPHHGKSHVEEKVRDLLAWIGTRPGVVLACRLESLPLNARIEPVELERLDEDAVREALQAHDGAHFPEHLLELSRTPFYLHELLRSSPHVLRDFGARPGDVLSRIVRRQLQRTGLADDLEDPTARLASAFALHSMEAFGSGAAWSDDLIEDEILRPLRGVNRAGDVVASGGSVQEQLTRCGLLVRSRAGRHIEFAHELLQQYLAGIEICRGLNSARAHSLLKLQDQPDRAGVALASDRGWRIGLPHPSPTPHESALLLAATDTSLDGAGFDELRQLNPLVAAKLIVNGQVTVEDAAVEYPLDLAQVLRGICRDQHASYRLRLAAGDTAAALAPIEVSRDLLVAVPGDEYEIGVAGEDLFRVWGTVARVQLEDFHISRAPVTRSMFNNFATEGGYDDRAHWTTAGWRLRIPPDQRPWPYSDMLDDPVTGVNLYEAEAFARWADARLPTEYEWEVAAGWTAQGRTRYPWGDDERAGAANVRTPSIEIGRTTPVGMYSTGDSGLGLHDMGGNVWEWCSSLYRDYAPSPGLEGHTIHPLRGGCFWSYLPSCANVSRLKRHAAYRLDVVGFRLAV